MTDEARDAVGEYRYGFHDPEVATIRLDKGSRRTSSGRSRS